MQRFLLSTQQELTAEDVIDVLQLYKLAAIRIFRTTVHLYFDREAKEIKFDIPAPGGYYSKKVAVHQLRYRVLRVEDLIEPAYIIKLVDSWIERLSIRQAEAIFWRYINHDFELLLDPPGRRRRYKTLTYEEIAERMQCSKQDVYIYTRRALVNIVEWVNSSKRRQGDSYAAKTCEATTQATSTVKIGLDIRASSGTCNYPAS